jgi:type I restriction enzyme, S subunit
VIDKQLDELERQRKAATALRQAVLKAAFSGHLVRQDPTDEPASALLARLATEAQVVASATPRRQPRRGRPPHLSASHT